MSNNNLLSFFDSVIEKPVSGKNITPSEIEKEYTSMFGHAVPREMIPSSISSTQIESALKQCIQSGKDNLLEYLNIAIDYNNKY